jgi:hypothetical protein
MKNILAFLIFLVLAFSAHAQQPFICTLPDLPSGQPSPPAAPPGACSIDFSTYDVSASFTIYVNLFFQDGTIDKILHQMKRYLLATNL